MSAGTGHSHRPRAAELEASRSRRCPDGIALAVARTTANRDQCKLLAPMHDAADEALHEFLSILNPLVRNACSRPSGRQARTGEVDFSVVRASFGEVHVGKLAIELRVLFRRCRHAGRALELMGAFDEVARPEAGLRPPDSTSRLPIGALVRILPSAPQSYHTLHGREARIVPPRLLDSPAFVRVRAAGSPRDAILRPDEIEIVEATPSAK